MFNGYAGDQGDLNLLRPHQRLIASLGIAQAPYRIEWGKLGPILLSPASWATGNPVGDQTMRLQTNSWSINLDFASSELANRVKLAMETLRAACDPVADTGF